MVVFGVEVRFSAARVCEGYSPPKVDRIWLWVHYEKIPIYPIFYLLKGDYILLKSLDYSRTTGVFWVVLWVIFEFPAALAICLRGLHKPKAANNSHFQGPL